MFKQKILNALKELGLPVSEVAKCAGISKQRFYILLDTNETLAVTKIKIAIKSHRVKLQKFRKFVRKL